MSVSMAHGLRTADYDSLDEDCLQASSDQVRKVKSLPRSVSLSRDPSGITRS